MNTNKLLAYLFVALGYVVNYTTATAQSTNNWAKQMPKNQTFIENKGQFTTPNNTNVLYALDYGKLKIYLTPTGMVYHILGPKRKTEHEREEIEHAMRKAGKSHAEIEIAEHKLDVKEEFIYVNFDNALTSAKVEASNKTTDYYSYSFNNAKGEIQNSNNINGYKKLKFKNIYPNIDLEYTTDVTEGLKYAFIVNVGGDASVIKMNYNTTNVTLKHNNVIINTLLGKVIDHAPKTFYANETQTTLASKFVKNNNIVSFDIAPYDHSKTLVIDPWTQTPTGLNDAQAVWEVERDGLGNVYIIGGDNPMKLLKYNNTGVLQWTHVTPYDTAGGSWLGTLATDLAGNSYVTQGSSPAIQKISNAGAVLWSKTGASDEYWSITFNCDQTKLIVGGTKSTFAIPTPKLEAAIFDMDVNNGNILAAKKVSAPGNLSAFPPQIQEVRAISASRNAKYYFLTHDTIGYINQNFGACGGSGNGALAAINSGYNFSYKCENYRTGGNASISAIKANKNFVYTQNGTTVHKRDLGTLAILATATIPGGAASTSLGKKVVENSGLDLDTCGNVYVGSSTGITKFDANLNLISSVTTTFKVYDVAVSTGGDVIAVGATGNSSSSSPRNGTVQSFNMGACFPIKLECCDATICNVPDKCVTDPAFQLVVAQSGGTFSGNGVSATGMFNPATAGVGTHSIVYTLPCGSDTLKITVKACANLVVCKETSGALQVTAGTGPYTWEKIVRTKDCSSGLCAFDCTLPQCSTYVTTFVNISNTTTATPSAATDTIRVKDSQGNELIIYDQSTLPSCNNCTFTPVIAVTLQPTTCTSTDGSATVTPISGATYSWNTTPIQTTNVATGLLTGSYTCTVTVGTCSTSVSIMVPCTATLVVCKKTDGSLEVSGGNAPYTWQVKSTTTDCSGCPGNTCIPFVCAGVQVTAWTTFTTGLTATAPNTTDSLRVKDVNGNTFLIKNATTPAACTTCSLVAGIQTKTDATCGANNGSATVTTTGATYSWNTTPVQTTQTATALPAGTYICTVTQGSCTDTAKVTITSSANIVASITAQSPAACGSSNGTAVVTNIAGATYSWNTTPIQTNDTAMNLAAGTYVCTVTQGSCTDTAKVTIVASANITASATSVNASCGNANGSAIAVVTGTPSTYTYSWNTNPVQTTQAITGLAAGTYICTVSQGACTDTAQVTITNSANMVITITGDTTICANGTTTLTASAPSATTYSWNTSPVQTTPAITVTPSTSTYYTVTASNGTCSGTQTVHVNALSTSSAYILGDTLVCLGEPVALTASTGTSYAWTPGGATSQSIVFVANVPATYSVVVTNATAPAACQTSTATISINIHPYTNTLNAGADQTISIGQAATLTATGATNGYSWSTNETTPSINVTPLKTTVYTVKSTDKFGCVTRDSVRVTVDLNCGDLFIATAFSPNDDGANDIECVLGSCVTAVSWAIYDRWGEKVFESNAVADCWNGTYKGKPLNTGVYVYKLTATLRSGEVVSKNGNITLTR